MKKLIDANVEAFDQALSVVSSISDSQYANRVNERSQPGAHIRHVLDHYRSLQDGMTSGTVDYDCRRRQSCIETDRNMAMSELLEVKNWFLTLAGNKSILAVKSEVSLCECCSVTITSDTDRELLYVLNHTVHHMAYVALLLEFNGAAVNKNIGMAPATASHLRTAVAS